MVARLCPAQERPLQVVGVFMVESLFLSFLHRQFLPPFFRIYFFLNSN